MTLSGVENILKNKNYKLMKGNCLDILKKIEPDSIDMVLTDPPYGIDLTPQRENGKFKDTKVINDDNLLWLNDFVDEI